MAENDVMPLFNSAQLSQLYPPPGSCPTPAHLLGAEAERQKENAGCASTAQQ